VKELGAKAETALQNGRISFMSHVEGFRMDGWMGR
jgi:hypothetical protein